MISPQRTVIEHTANDDWYGVNYRPLRVISLWQPAQIIEGLRTEVYFIMARINYN